MSRHHRPKGTKTVIGDGNIVGNHNRNNQIYVDKRRSTHIHSPSSDESNAFLPLVIVFLAAVVGTLYYGSLHAQVVYAFIIATSFTVVLSAGIGTLSVLGRNEPLEWSDAPAPVLAIGSLALTWYARETYPLDLTRFAHQAGGAVAFWCGLLPYGRQLGLQQILTLLFGAFGSLLLLPFMLRSLLTDTLQLAPEWVTRTCAPWLYWISALCVVLMGATTLFGSVFVQWLPLDSSFFCPNHH